MQPEIKKNENALFRNILGAFLFDLTLTYLVVLVISLFIPHFYSGEYPISVSFNLFFIFYIFFYIANLLAGLLTSQTPGMRLYNIYFYKGFNFLNVKTKIPLSQTSQNFGWIRYVLSIYLDDLLAIIFSLLFGSILNLGVFTASIPTGGFLISSSIQVLVPHLIFSIFLYYIFSISFWGRTPGMALLKIKVPFYKRTIAIFERLILLILIVVFFFIVAPYFV